MSSFWAALVSYIDPTAGSSSTADSELTRGCLDDAQQQQQQQGLHGLSAQRTGASSRRAACATSSAATTTATEKRRDAAVSEGAYLPVADGELLFGDADDNKDSNQQQDCERRQGLEISYHYNNIATLRNGETQVEDDEDNNGDSDVRVTTEYRHIYARDAVGGYDKLHGDDDDEDDEEAYIPGITHDAAYSAPQSPVSSDQGCPATSPTSSSDSSAACSSTARTSGASSRCSTPSRSQGSGMENSEEQLIDKWDAAGDVGASQPEEERKMEEETDEQTFSFLKFVASAFFEFGASGPTAASVDHPQASATEAAVPAASGKFEEIDVKPSPQSTVAAAKQRHVPPSPQQQQQQQQQKPPPDDPPARGDDEATNPVRNICLLAKRLAFCTLLDVSSGNERTTRLASSSSLTTAAATTAARRHGPGTTYASSTRCDGGDSASSHSLSTIALHYDLNVEHLRSINRMHGPGFGVGCDFVNDRNYVAVPLTPVPVEQAPLPTSLPLLRDARESLCDSIRTVYGDDSPLPLYVEVVAKSMAHVYQPLVRDECMQRAHGAAKKTKVIERDSCGAGESRVALLVLPLTHELPLNRGPSAARIQLFALVPLLQLQEMISADTPCGMFLLTLLHGGSEGSVGRYYSLLFELREVPRRAIVILPPALDDVLGFSSLSEPSKSTAKGPKKSRPPSSMEKVASAARWKSFVRTHVCIENRTLFDFTVYVCVPVSCFTSIG